ncbi:MAG: PEP-CTERM sorting domain-containing protein [Betaproteobacteria bacterium]
MIPTTPRSLGACAALLAATFALASGPAAAAAAGNHYSLTLTYDDMVAPPAVGSFVLGAEVAGHPGDFLVSAFSVVIGIPGYAYDYDMPDPALAVDPATGMFGVLAGSHAYTSAGDQLDLISDFYQWKTDDFNDPHPACDVAHCSGFHYGSYAAAAVSVPEPAGLPLALLGLAALAPWAWRRRAGAGRAR